MRSRLRMTFFVAENNRLADLERYNDSKKIPARFQLWQPSHVLDVGL